MGNALTFCPAESALAVLSRSQKHFGEDTCRGEILGSGRFARVFVCWRRSQPEKRFALKCITKNLRSISDEPDGREEVRVMRFLASSGGSPYLVSLIEATQYEGSLQMVLELCTGRELYTRIKEKGFYCEDEAREVTRRLALGLAFMHSRGVMHRDLKPENVFLVSKSSDTEVKIGDFGLAVRSKCYCLGS